MAFMWTRVGRLANVIYIIFGLEVKRRRNKIEGVDGDHFVPLLPASQHDVHWTEPQCINPIEFQSVFE